MNKIIISAINKRGSLALKNYCNEFKDKKPSWQARVVQKVLPYSEEVDDLNNPKKLVVTLSKVFEAHAHVILLKVQKSIFNILSKFGGEAKDFRVSFE